MVGREHRKIVIVGEAFGRQEAIYNRPFVGAAGDQLNQLLADAGIINKTIDPFAERDRVVFITNVFNFRPPAEDNSILSICCARKDLPNKGAGYKLPALTQGKYVKPEFLGELSRLRSELEEVRPNIVVAAGNTAMWALTQQVGLDKYRGAVVESTLVPGLKVIPTFHPASLFRVWNRRPILIADLMKAREEAERPTITRRHRQLWLEPSLADLEEFWIKHLQNAEIISVDIENPRDIISCLAFAPTPDLALVVPFEDDRKPANSYWPTRAEEVLAWRFVRKVLASPTPKLFQNGIYDTAHLLTAKCPVRNFAEDTMLLHHALQPEERKGLGHLGSLYTNESAWKTMGNVRGDKTIKRDA